MSQKHSMAEQQNVYLSLNKIPGRSQPINRTNVAGIIEHYSYKTENRDLIDKISKKQVMDVKMCTSMPIYTRNKSTNQGMSTNVTSNLHRKHLNLNSTIVSPPKYHIVHEKVPLVQTMDIDKVRTEHCDSTTDIIEAYDINNAILFEPPITTHFNVFPMQYKKMKTSKNVERWTSTISTKNYKLESDDDSDCEIIDVNNGDSNVRTVVVDWMPTNTNAIPEPEVFVISDDSDTEFLCERTGMKKKSKLVCSQLLRTTSQVQTAEENVLEKLNCTVVKQGKDSIGLINEKYQKVKSELKTPGQPKMISNPPDVCSIKQQIETSPKQVKVQSPKGCSAPLSPESIKTEFYSYLKINTNPSAQKAETIATNRRSTRVKNLNLQILQKKPEKFNNNEVRKKFLNYSKKYDYCVFPRISFEHNQMKEFDEIIESYFKKEQIPYGQKKIFNELFANNRNKRFKSVSSEEEEQPDERAKKINILSKKEVQLLESQKVILQKKSRKKLPLRQNPPQATLRRLRFKPNRIFRDSFVRITRHSLDGYKLKSRKLKSKIKANFKIKKNQSNVAKLKKITIKSALETRAPPAPPQLTISTIATKPPQIIEPKLTIREVIITSTNSKTPPPSKPIQSQPKITITEVPPPAPIPLKLIPQPPPQSKSLSLPNVLAEKLSQAIQKHTPKPRPYPKFFLNCVKTFNTTKPSSSIRSSSPALAGFNSTQIESSIKTSNSIQERVSHLHTEILVRSSPIQTPEPVDHLVPEMCLNSIPLSNEPCDLHEVMSSIVASQVLHEETTNNSDYQEHLDIADIIDSTLIEKTNPNIIPFNQNIKAKSFHKSLMQTKVAQKSVLSSLFEQSDSDSSISAQKQSPNNRNKSLTHEIDITAKGGAMFTTYYINGILLIVQEFIITFWKQTALGNILGTQNMWLPNGSLQRIILERGCVNRRSSEMVLSCDNSVAYIELWTKQHESKFRECPIADVFATIYYHRGHGTPDKKVLQLENIKGYGHDVRFVVIKSSRQIIVSWCDTFAEPIKTLIRSYQLAPDFQTISSIKEMEYVHHYLLSLHNINDCDDLILGAGSEQISVWNLRYGYLVTTLNLAESTIPSTLENKTMLLYAQCDTGFLFLIQQIEVGVLRLVAVNGMTQEWKQLQSYKVPTNYQELLGIIVESGVLMTCYTNGFLCWNMSNGDILAEIDLVDSIVLPTNKYLVAFNNFQVKVQHIMSYILTNEW